MGWFSKKEQKEDAAPALPELPRLPELPTLKGKKPEPISQLPSFPTNSLGEKFSQNTIKQAVTGKKEGKEVEADDFAHDMDMQTMHEPLTREISPRENYHPANIEIDELSSLESERVHNNEPIFVRLDRFEESIGIFNEIKNQVAQAERFLEETKRIKEQEEEELNAWEEELQLIKNQIEKVNKNIFSKVS